ncbi:MAG: hypothetical protein H8D23_04080 [Candidatus Brocadiales bacterium]|nr:hypothetical protein [Candidatus Brocadiales bacterium]
MTEHKKNTEQKKKLVDQYFVRIGNIKTTATRVSFVVIFTLLFTWLTGIVTIPGKLEERRAEIHKKNILQFLDERIKANSNLSAYEDAVKEREKEIKKLESEISKKEKTQAKIHAENVENRHEKLKEKVNKKIREIESIKLRSSDEIRILLSKARQILGHIPQKYQKFKLLDDVRDANNKKAKLKDISEIIINGKTKQHEKIKRTNEALKTSFSIPGVDDIPVKSLYAPIIWSLLMLGYIFYMSHARSTILNLCGRALRILRSELKIPKESTADIAGGAPWWLAPIPRQHGSEVSVEDMRDALGWGPSYRIATLCVVFALILFGYLQLIVIKVGIEIYHEISSESKIYLSTFTFIILGSTIFFVLRWFRLASIPDNYADEKGSHRLARRQILWLISTVVVSGVMPNSKVIYNSTFKLFQSTQEKKLARNPRFRRKKKASDYVSQLKTGFYENPSTQIVHYVSDEKKIADTNRINELHLKTFSLDKLLSRGQHPRVHLASSSYSFERAAILHLKNKDYDNACKMLIHGINHDILFKLKTWQPTSFRLFDLLAKISIRFKQNQHFDTLILKARDHRLNGVLDARINKWTNTLSFWRKRLDDPSREISWAGILK